MIRIYGGEDLEKVLIYYGVINQTESAKIKIVCPFHGDVNPSMSVNLAKGTFFCFGCRAKGTAFDFVKMIHPEYDDLLVALEIEKIIRSKMIEKLQIKKKIEKKINTRLALAEADDYYYGLSVVDWNETKTEEEKVVLSYMKKRGFSESALNVSDCRVSCNKEYPIIFPILDNSVFYGYVCRTMNKKTESYRKYLYNKGFKKRYVLCGEYEENTPLFVCEGYLDYLSLKTRGKIKNVVALLGWHASDEQIKKMKEKNINTIVCALDNPDLDSSGLKGFNLLKKNFDVIPFSYPEGIKDAGDMTEKQIKEAIKEVRYEIRKLSNSKHRCVNEKW